MCFRRVTDAGLSAGFAVTAAWAGASRDACTVTARHVYGRQILVVTDTWRRAGTAMAPAESGTYTCVSVCVCACVCVCDDECSPAQFFTYHIRRETYHIL